MPLPGGFIWALINWTPVSSILDHEMPLTGGHLTECQPDPKANQMSSWPDVVPLLVSTCLYWGVHLTNLMTYSVVAFKCNLPPQLQINIICLLNYRLTTTTTTTTTTKLQINSNDDNNNKKSNLHTHSTFLFNFQELIST